MVRFLVAVKLSRCAQEERQAELEKKKERAKRFNMPIAVTKEDVR